MEKIELNLNENEIKALCAYAGIDQDKINADSLMHAIHDMIQSIQIKYEFTVECTADIGDGDGNIYFSEGNTYTVRTSDFREFEAETDFGIGNLSEEDLTDNFKIDAISDDALLVALSKASEETADKFLDYASEVQNLFYEKEQLTPQFVDSIHQKIDARDVVMYRIKEFSNGYYMHFALQANRRDHVSMKTQGVLCNPDEQVIADLGTKDGMFTGKWTAEADGMKFVCVIEGAQREREHEVLKKPKEPEIG